MNEELDSLLSEKVTNLLLTWKVISIAVDGEQVVSSSSMLHWFDKAFPVQPHESVIPWFIQLLFCQSVPFHRSNIWKWLISRSETIKNDILIYGVLINTMALKLIHKFIYLYRYTCTLTSLQVSFPSPFFLSGVLKPRVRFISKSFSEGKYRKEVLIHLLFCSKIHGKYIILRWICPDPCTCIPISLFIDLLIQLM